MTIPLKAAGKKALSVVAVALDIDNPNHFKIQRALAGFEVQPLVPSLGKYVIAIAYDNKRCGGTII